LTRVLGDPMMLGGEEEPPVDAWHSAPNSSRVTRRLAIAVGVCFAILVSACSSTPAGSPGAAASSPTAAATATATPEATATASPTPTATATSAATEPLSGEDPFELAATAKEVDTSKEVPDPSTFTTTFAADTPTIYVVYKLKQGLSGTVKLTWRKDGQLVLEQSFALPEDRWGYGGVNRPSPAFPTGNYEIELELAETGGGRTLQFTVAAG
jgi:hypothetical protein